MEERRGNTRKGFTVSDISAYVHDVDFPAWKEDFIIAAEDADASTDVLSLLETLNDEEYETKEDFEQMLREILHGQQ